MDHRDGAEAGEARFAAYVERLASVLGHADRAAPLKAYCTGLILPGKRKSIEPIAARVEPGRVQAVHQSLHHFVAKADWSDEALLAVVRAEALPEVEQHGPIRAWIIDGPQDELPEEGAAFRRGDASVLRPARQAGQLPDRRHPLGGQRACEPSGRLSALSAGGLGKGSGAP